jgi:anti-anti-sigma factor
MQVMNLTEERVGDILVIRLDGRLDHEGGLAFERATSAQIELGCRSLVVDFCGVSFLASMGIRALMLIGNRFRPYGALARSLKLEAVISMPRRCQMGL